MKQDCNILNAVLRNDLASLIAKVFATVDGSQPFLPNWHIDVIADHLERAARGEIKRLIINLPPRSLKSICASVAFPAWVLGHDPTARIICASYGDDLARKHARDCRAVMTSDWYRRAFPGTRLNRKKSAEDDFETTKRGGRLATSVGGPLTGRGGNIIIIDDPIKAQDALSASKRGAVNQWFDGTLFSRLDNKNDGIIIIVMQRVHIDDLVAHVQDKENWTVVDLPAIAEAPEHIVLDDGREFHRDIGDILHPERESRETLERIRSDIGLFFFEAQYQQRPVPEGGNLIKWEWFKTYKDPPPLTSSADCTVQSWDIAMTENAGSDWSVCSTWAVRGGDYYLIDVFRGRLRFPGLKRKVYELRHQHTAKSVLIEDANASTGLIQQLQHEGKLRPIAIKPKGSKIERMGAETAEIEAGRVWLPESAPWLDVFRVEVLAFPQSRHDDQVDTMSQFLNWVSRRGQGTIRMIQVVGF